MNYLDKLWSTPIDLSPQPVLKLPGELQDESCNGIKAASHGHVMSATATLLMSVKPTPPSPGCTVLVLNGLYVM